MKNRQLRKKELLSSMLRRENWELEAIKSDNARAQRLLDRENKALDEARDSLAATFDEMRRLMESDDALKIDELQRINQYLAQLSREQSECETRQRRVQSEADQIAEQLKRKLLYTRGLAAIEDSTANGIADEQEKTVQRDNEELWVQRNGNRK